VVTCELRLTPASTVEDGLCTYSTLHDASNQAWQAGSIVNTSVGWPQRKIQLDMGDIYCSLLEKLAHDMQLNISLSASVKVMQAG
jgi:hypothetical protein